MAQALVALILVLILAEPTAATTYYVGTSGNDANAGTIGSRWRNPQKCAQPPVAAGDTCLVGNGTYTAAEAGSTAFVIQISTAKSSATGTLSAPITIKSENWLGATLVQPTRNAAAVAIYVAKSHYIVEGFEISGDGVSYDTGTSASHAGIGIYASNVTVRRNTIHHIARAQCSNSAFGNAGIYTHPGLSNLLIEKNYLYTIGRLRNGESGCVTSIFQHDHGIYITWGTDITVQQNAIYDSNRGYCMNIYSAAGSVHTRYRIYNNLCAGRSPTGLPSGHIIIGGTWVNGEIKNNSFFQPDADLIIQQYQLSASSSGNVISHNRTNLDLPGADFLFGGATPAGFSSSNNVENVSLGLTDALCTQADGGCQNHDFTLAAGSGSIDAGVNVGLPFNGSAPDVGPWESFAFASCEVPFGAANTIQLTFTSNANVLGDVLTTFTARRNGTNNALTGAATKIGDTIVSLPVTTTYGAGDTVDWSWSSGGFSDRALIGGSLNQPFSPVTNQSCTNNAGGAPTYSLTQAAFQYRGVYGPETTTDIRGPENLASYEVVVNGAARVRIAVTNAVSNAPSLGLVLRYARNGGAYTVMPGSFGADGIAMCGNRYPNIGVVSGTSTTNQMSTGGTFVPGAVVLEALAIPTITGLNVGYKTELEDCVTWDETASGTYTFRLYEQSGAALGTYAQTPSVVIVPPRGGGMR